ncbi:hypothetical protein MD484_g3355, partial [Candolleomyces efflorescens]
MERIDSSQAEEASAIVQGRIDVILNSCQILLQHSSIAFAEELHPNRFGQGTVAGMLFALMSHSTIKLGVSQKKKALDVALAVFLATDVPIKMNHKQYGSCVQPITGLISRFMEGDVHKIYYRMAEQFTGRTHRRFVRACVNHVKQWEQTYIQYPQGSGAREPEGPRVTPWEVILALVHPFQRLSGIKGSLKAFLDSDFLPEMFRIFFNPLLNRGLSPSQSQNGYRVESLCPIGIVSNLLPPPRLLDISQALQIVPRLLHGRTLELITTRLLKERGQLATKFATTYAKGISELVFHPRIFLAVASAIEGLPDSALQSLWSDSNREVAEILIPIISNFHQCRSAFEGPALDKPRLCDSLEHAATSKVPLDKVNPTQCSHCHAVVYCSAECQRRDWGMFHKKECPGSRMEYIDRKNEGSWISHRDRSLFLRLLTHYMEEARSSPAVREMNPDGSPSNTGFVFDSVLGVKIPWLKTWRNTIIGRKVDPDQMGRLLGKDGVPVFGDERSRAMLQEFKNEKGSIQVACMALNFGQQSIIVIGRFASKGGPGERGQKSKPFFALLNGYVKVLDKELDWNEFDENVGGGTGRGGT